MTRRFFGVLGMVAALGAGGCASDWESRYEQSQRENLDLVQQLEEMRSSTATDAARAEAALNAQKAAERDAAKLLAERNEAARRAEEWRAKAESAVVAAKPVPAPAVTESNPVATSLADTLRKTYPDGVRITPEGNVELTLASDVTFGSGSDVVSDAAKKSLKSLAGKLNGEFGGYAIRIVGHTDNDPVVRTKAKFHDNLGLSTARANAVSRFMQEEMKIDGSRLTSSGVGETRPIADNKSAAGKSKNRRVEIVVYTSAAAK